MVKWKEGVLTLAVWPWTRHWFSLGLGFLIYKLDQREWSSWLLMLFWLSSEVWSTLETPSPALPKVTVLDESSHSLVWRRRVTGLSVQNIWNRIYFRGLRTEADRSTNGSSVQASILEGNDANYNRMPALLTSISQRCWRFTWHQMTLELPCHTREHEWEQLCVLTT